MQQHVPFLGLYNGCIGQHGGNTWVPKRPALRWTSMANGVCPPCLHVAFVVVVIYRDVSGGDVAARVVSGCCFFLRHGLGANIYQQDGKSGKSNG